LFSSSPHIRDFGVIMRLSIKLLPGFENAALKMGSIPGGGPGGGLGGGLGGGPGGGFGGGQGGKYGSIPGGGPGGRLGDRPDNSSGDGLGGRPSGGGRPGGGKPGGGGRPGGGPGGRGYSPSRFGVATLMISVCKCSNRNGTPFSVEFNGASPNECLNEFSFIFGDIILFGLSCTILVGVSKAWFCSTSGR